MKRFCKNTLVLSLLFISAFGALFLVGAREVSATAPPVRPQTPDRRGAENQNMPDLPDEVTKGCFTVLKAWFPVPWINVNACIALGANFVMWLSARFLWLSGILLNYALGFTLNMADMLAQIPIVDIGWKIIRDISNVVFIFVALWSGISITIGLQAEKAWGLLAHMVLAALFINFSLFITKAIVDASNVAALHFYNLITPEVQRNNLAEGSLWGKFVDADAGLSEAFMAGLHLETLYDSRSVNAQGANAQRNGSVAGFVGGRSGEAINFVSIILVGIFGSILMMVASFVFFAGAFMFIIRAVTLCMLMILSPLAFVAWILPGASGLASQWWSKLWSQSLFAPLYLALAYVVVATINSPGFRGLTTITGGRDTFARALTSDSPQFASIIFSFILMIGLMVGCLIVAQSLGARGSELMMDWGKRLRVAGQGLAGRFVMRGFGTETYKDWASRRGERYKELAQQETDPGKRDSLLALSDKWEKRSKSKWVPNLSLRKLDEKWERGGSILGGKPVGTFQERMRYNIGSLFGGKGAIGSVLREQTTQRFVHDWTFGSSASAAKGYEQDEARISAAKDLEYEEDAENANERLHRPRGKGKPSLRQEEKGLQDAVHQAKERVAELKRKLDEAVKSGDTAEQAALRAQIAVAEGEEFSKAKKDLEAAEKSGDPAAIEAAKAAALAAGLKGGLAANEEALKAFYKTEGSAIQHEVKIIATALARMSTEGFLKQDKSFFRIPEVMNINVLGADKYNALMASEHYTNPEKIEYSNARVDPLREQGERLKKENEWYLEAMNRVEVQRQEVEKKKAEWEAKKKAEEMPEAEAEEELKKAEEEFKRMEDEAKKAAPADKVEKEKLAKAQGEEVKKKKTALEAKRNADAPRVLAAAKLKEAEETLAKLEADATVSLPADKARKERDVEMQKKAVEARKTTLAEATKARADEVKRTIGEEPKLPADFVEPEPPGWDATTRRALRNMRNPQELMNYYRYARDIIDMPPFVQTVLQGMWNKLRESDAVDSFTKEQTRVIKRLYLQEASDGEFGLSAVMMKRWEEVDPVGAQRLRDEINDFVLTHSEEEYKKKYFDEGKLNKLLEERLRPQLAKFSEEVRESIEREFTVSPDEHRIRNAAGERIMVQQLQNLADDEATMMNGTLRNLHWIKTKLNRAMLAKFSNRDNDVKIPDIEKLVHSVGEMFKGNNKVSRENLDFIVWLVNERAGKDFAPFDQMTFKQYENPRQEKELWEIIKRLAYQRGDPTGSKYKTKYDALKAAVQMGYFTGVHGAQDIKSFWREMGIHHGNENEMSEADFYRDLLGKKGDIKIS